MNPRKAPDTWSSFIPKVKYALVALVAILISASYLGRDVSNIVERIIGPLLLLILFVILPVIAVRSLVDQPGGSYKKVFLRVGLFFAVAIVLTAVIVGLGYIFHAPGINPR